MIEEREKQKEKSNAGVKKIKQYKQNNHIKKSQFEEKLKEK